VKILPTALADIIVIEPEVLRDARGFFLESYHAQRYTQAGLPTTFVQDNHSRSTRGTLRGLHYQLTRPQGKLVRAVRGAAFDVAVDVRRDSPTFARWISLELSDENQRQVYIPPGFAHGFCALTEPCEIEYKCTDYYAAEDQHGIPWNDPLLAIRWPVSDPLLSDRDRTYAPLTPDRSDLPRYEARPT